MINAKFQADFSGFLAAVDKAQLSLVDFSKGAGKVEGSLNRMVDNFSGRKVIQEASLMTIAVEKAGGTAALTERELAKIGTTANQAADKLNRLGYEVPAGLQKIADETRNATSKFSAMDDVIGGLERQLLGVFSVGAVIAFGREVLDAGDKIQKMSDQTGLSVGEVQKLDYIAGQSGTSIQSLIGAVQNLQVRLGDENTGAAGAFAKLGIEADAFAKLSTYEQLTSLGGAIKDIRDPTEQASIAAALFGKTWKEILPAIKAGMSEVGDQAAIMSDNSVKATDAIGDGLKAMQQRAVALAGGIAGLGLSFDQFLAKRGYTTGYVAELDKDFGSLESAMKKIPPVTLAVGEGIKVMGAKEKDTALAVLDLTQRAKDSIEVHKQQAAAAKKAADEIEHFRNSVQSVHFGQFVKDGLPMVGLIQDFGAANVATQESFHNLSATVNEFHDGITIAGNEIYSVTIPAFATLSGGVAQNTKLIDQATRVTETWRGHLEALGKSFTHLAQISQGAFGDVARVIGQTVASFKLIEESSQSFKDGLKDYRNGDKTAGFLQIAGSIGGMVAAMDQATSHASKLGNTLHGALTGAEIGQSLGGPIGAAIGAVAGGLIGLFRDIETKINPVRQAFVDMNGGLAELNAKAAAAGASLTAMLNARTPEQYKQAIDDLNAALDRQKKFIADSNTELGNLFTGLQNSAGKIPDAMQPAIQKLIEMGRITKENAALFGLMSGSTEVDFKKMQEVAGKYGIDLASLGPKFQSAKLHDAAATIINDFDVLTRNGGDVGGVLFGMRGNISKLVTDSLKFGVEIPRNMEPWINELLRSGNLTDENGNKLTTLSGLKFADPIKTEFQKIVDKLQELIDKIVLPGGVVAAINGIPTEKRVHIGFDVDALPRSRESDYAASGGFVTGSGVQYLAGGGNVLRFMPKGSDTVPAMLTPGEGVVSQRGMKTLGKAGLSALNAGSASAGADLSGMRESIDNLAQAMADRDRMLPKMIRDAILLAPPRAA